MNLEENTNMNMNMNMNMNNLQEQCKKYITFHVTLKMLDGSTVEGILEGIENGRIIILVGEDVMERENTNQVENQRQPSMGGPRRRFRRYRRNSFPINALAALALVQYPGLLPFFFL